MGFRVFKKLGSALGYAVYDSIRTFLLCTSVRIYIYIHAHLYIHVYRVYGSFLFGRGVITPTSIICVGVHQL